MNGLLTTFLMNILFVTLEESVLILLLLAFGPLLRRRYAASARTLLWVLVAFRMLIVAAFSNTSLQVQVLDYGITDSGGNAYDFQYVTTGMGLTAGERDDTARAYKLMDDGRAVSNGKFYRLDHEMINDFLGKAENAPVIGETLDYMKVEEPDIGPEDVNSFDDMLFDVSGTYQRALSGDTEEEPAEGFAAKASAMADAVSQGLASAAGFVYRHALLMGGVWLAGFLIFWLCHGILWFRAGRKRTSGARILGLAANSIHWFDPFAYVMAHRIDCDREPEPGEETLEDSGEQPQDDGDVPVEARTQKEKKAGCGPVFILSLLLLGSVLAAGASARAHAYSIDVKTGDTKAYQGMCYASDIYETESVENYPWGASVKKADPHVAEGAEDVWAVPMLEEDTDGDVSEYMLKVPGEGEPLTKGPAVFIMCSGEKIREYGVLAGKRPDGSAFAGEPDRETESADSFFAARSAAGEDNPLFNLFDWKDGATWEISIAFGEGEMPDVINVEDVVLNDDGTPRYSGRTGETMYHAPMMDYGSDTCYINLMQHSAIGLYEEETGKRDVNEPFLRGYSVECRWVQEDGVYSCTYLFALRISQTAQADLGTYGGATDYDVIDTTTYPWGEPVPETKPEPCAGEEDCYAVASYREDYNGNVDRMLLKVPMEGNGLEQVPEVTPVCGAGPIGRYGVLVQDHPAGSSFAAPAGTAAESRESFFRAQAARTEEHLVCDVGDWKNGNADTIFLYFPKGQEPDAAVVRDVVLNDDGTFRYPGMEGEVVYREPEIDRSVSSLSFGLANHSAIHLHEYSVEDRPDEEPFLRGYSVECHWVQEDGVYSCTYLFEIKTRKTL